MYKIHADNTLIYDSTFEDYRISQGNVTLETNKSGSFTFGLYPDHFYYDSFVKMKTVVAVRKSDRIVFRGRVLNDTVNYHNNKVFTCEGELGFLQDSIIRPFDFTGTPEAFFAKIINEHNAQVDDFKRFKVGNVTVKAASITRSNTGYETALSNLSERCTGSELGGYIHITHDGGDEIPTIHWLEAFTTVATQSIEFGENLKDYAKTAKADDIGTAVIPLGKTVDDGKNNTEDPKLTIASVNGGVDYVYSPAGVALYGWIFKVVSWDEIETAKALKAKAEEYVETLVNQAITLDLTAVDLHLHDRSIESFHLNDYIRAKSAPHNFDMTLLCNKQTLDLLKPANDTVTLGHSFATFTELNSKITNVIRNVSSVQSVVNTINNKVGNMNATIVEVEKNTQQATADIENLSNTVSALNNSYSTTEAAAGGAWIDGKPIYKRTFICNITAESTYTEAGTIANLDSVVEITGTTVVSSGNWSTVNSYYSGNYSKYVRVTSDGVVQGYSVGNAATMYITVYYTKTG